MELLKLTEPVQVARWDGTGTLNYLRSLKEDLIDCYNFVNVEDSLEITGGDGTGSIAWTGKIKLYIDTTTYLQFDLYKYGTSYAVGIKLDVVSTSGSSTIYYKSNHGPDWFYYAHAIWKTKTNQLIVSCATSDSVGVVTPLTRGLSFVLGTSTNQYTNISIPTILLLENDKTSTNQLLFKNTESTTNRVVMANEKLRATTSVQLITNSSNIAVLAPIVSPDNHYVMDNILCSTLIPSCFSDSYSTIEYKDHTYAQFGRYLLLDEAPIE